MTTQQMDKLKEEFEKKFTRINKGNGELEQKWFVRETTSEEMWSFISSNIKKERDARLKFVKRMKLEFDVCVCECGEKWSETDGADLVKEELNKLK